MTWFNKSKDLSNTDLKAIWDANSDTFKLFMHQEQQKYPDKKGMKPDYIDGKGKAYYRLSSYTLQPPMERIAKGQDFMLMMARGLNDDELQKLIDAANNELALAYAGKPNRVPIVVGAVLKAMEDRKSLLLHIDLMYEYLAVFTIREDEEVGHFNQEIHDEKVKQFKEDNRGKNSFFFFQLPELTKVNEALSLSESEWMQQCEESQRKIEALKQWTRNLSTGVKKSEKPKQTEKSM